MRSLIGMNLDMCRLGLYCPIRQLRVANKVLTEGSSAFRSVVKYRETTQRFRAYAGGFSLRRGNFGWEVLPSDWPVSKHVGTFSWLMIVAGWPSKLWVVPPMNRFLPLVPSSGCPVKSQPKQALSSQVGHCANHSNRDRLLAARAREPGSALSIHKLLTVICNPSSRESAPFFWLLWILACMWYTKTHISTHTCTYFFLKKITCCPKLSHWFLLN